MFSDLLTARVNLAIVLLGAFGIIFGIHLTPHLVPAQFYFNFSKLVGGGSEPFLVDPPGIRADKLCDLLAKHGFDQDIFRTHITCSEPGNDDADRARQRKDDIYTRSEIDRIYAIALQSDLTLRTMLTTAGKKFSFTPLSDEEMTRDIATSPAASVAFDTILRHYTDQLGPPVRDTLRDTVARLYSELGKSRGSTDANQADDSAPASEESRMLSQEAYARIVSAHKRFLSKLSELPSPLTAEPITKSKLDELLTNSPDMLASNIAAYYADTIRARYDTLLKAAFAAEGVSIGSDADQRVVLTEILHTSYVNYIVAIIVRLLPVLLFGFVAGVFLGREELTSISLAGAFSAFLLSWPLMLLWERLVNSAWADRKPTFLVFYAIYILSFFLTARAAAILGASARSRLGLGTRGEAVANAALFTWREVAVNLAGAAVINVMLYAWNVVIPFSAVGPR